MSTYEEEVDWPEPAPDPPEEPSESRVNDGTPGAVALEGESMPEPETEPG